MRFEAIFLVAAAASASAQTVVGTAYGFATGTTGGGSATAVTPSDAAELATLLSDDTARVILIDKEYDFTGTSAKGAGCNRKSCSATSGGQYYLGDLSCAAGDDIVAVSSITYDAAGSEPLVVGSNKSILGVGGKGVIKGKGLRLASGASNVIIQGIEITTINPSVVWGGDALDFQGANDGVWIDHCKFSLIGRMFIVSHYKGSRVTISNNEFDGVTDTSATCNNNHYWTMMFISDDEQITLDRNYFHDVSGRAPKLGQDGVAATFHAVNNYFENMKGHAFDAYDGASALVEGNVFKAVSQPSTDKAAAVATFVVDGGSACSSALGRTCLANSVDSSSGKLAGGSSSSFISKIAKYDVTTTLAVSEVAAHVLANAGPANLGAATTNATTTTTKTTASEIENVVVVETPTTSKTPVTSQTASSSSSSTGTAKLYAQCGGSGFTGPTSCEAPAICAKQNDFYSQCIGSTSKFRR
ncbi:carbohydrate-binding module family 1 protein, partial [Pleomassaria siparia CBS 279.74]